MRAPAVVLLLLAATGLLLVGPVHGSDGSTDVQATLSVADGYSVRWNLTTPQAHELLEEARARLEFPTADPPAGTRGGSPGAYAGDLRFDGRGGCTVRFLQLTPLFDPRPRWVPRGISLHEGGALDVETGWGRHVSSTDVLPDGELPASYGYHDSFRAVGHGWALELRWRVGAPTCVAAIGGVGYAEWRHTEELLAPPPPPAAPAPPS